jgi:hypothetical protein
MAIVCRNERDLSDTFLSTGNYQVESRAAHTNGSSERVAVRTARLLRRASLVRDERFPPGKTPTQSPPASPQPSAPRRHDFTRLTYPQMP